MPSFENTGKHDLLKRVYATQSPEESRAAYDEWASKYDEDLAEQDYIAPSLVAKAIAAHTSAHDLSAPILDAGCGTGLTGVALAQAGWKFIDGLDFSPGMLEIAKKTGVYRDLWTADLTKEIKQPEGSYAAVTCVGTLTKGHVGPSPAIAEFVRITREGGVVAVTILNDVFESDGYAAEVERLREQGKVELLQSEKCRIGGRGGVDIMSRIVVLQRK